VSSKPSSRTGATEERTRDGIGMGKWGKEMGKWIALQSSGGWLRLGANVGKIGRGRGTLRT